MYSLIRTSLSSNFSVIEYVFSWLLWLRLSVPDYRCNLLPGMTGVRRDLWCVDWDVKLHSFIHPREILRPTASMTVQYILRYIERRLEPDWRRSSDLEVNRYGRWIIGQTSRYRPFVIARSEMSNTPGWFISDISLDLSSINFVLARRGASWPGTMRFKRSRETGGLIFKK